MTLAVLHSASPPTFLFRSCTSVSFCVLLSFGLEMVIGLRKRISRSKWDSKDVWTSSLLFCSNKDQGLFLFEKAMLLQQRQGICLACVNNMDVWSWSVSWISYLTAWRSESACVHAFAYLIFCFCFNRGTGTSWSEKTHLYTSCVLSPRRIYYFARKRRQGSFRNIRYLHWVLKISYTHVQKHKHCARTCLCFN